MSHELFKTYTKKKIFVFNLKFKFNWASSILYDSPTLVFHLASADRFQLEFLNIVPEVCMT